MGDISFTGADLTVLGAILGALTGAITFLFKALIASKDSVISDLHQERDYWREMALGHAPPDSARSNYPPR